MHDELLHQPRRRVVRVTVVRVLTASHTHDSDLVVFELEAHHFDEATAIQSVLRNRHVELGFLAFGLCLDYATVMAIPSTATLSDVED